MAARSQQCGVRRCRDNPHKTAPAYAELPA
jgi:hypothetical protein